MFLWRGWSAAFFVAQISVLACFVLCVVCLWCDLVLGLYCLSTFERNSVMSPVSTPLVMSHRSSKPVAAGSRKVPGSGQGSGSVRSVAVQGRLCVPDWYARGEYARVFFGAVNSRIRGLVRSGEQFSYSALWDEHNSRFVVMLRHAGSGNAVTVHVGGSAYPIKFATTPFVGRRAPRELQAFVNVREDRMGGLIYRARLNNLVTPVQGSDVSGAPLTDSYYTFDVSMKQNRSGAVRRMNRKRSS